MQDVERAFNDLGIDAVMGVELMDWLGVSMLDLGDPLRFSRLGGVIDYFKQFPLDTQRFIIKKVTSGKNVDKLQHVWEYTGLLSKKQYAEQALSDLKKEISAVGEEADLSIAISLSQRETSAKEHLNKIMDEISIYER